MPPSVANTFFVKPTESRAPAARSAEVAKPAGDFPKRLSEAQGQASSKAAAPRAVQAKPAKGVRKKAAAKVEQAPEARRPDEDAPVKDAPKLDAEPALSSEKASDNAPTNEAKVTSDAQRREPAVASPTDAAKSLNFLAAP